MPKPKPPSSINIAQIFIFDLNETGLLKEEKIENLLKKWRGESLLCQEKRKGFSFGTVSRAKHLNNLIKKENNNVVTGKIKLVFDQYQPDKTNIFSVMEALEEYFLSNNIKPYILTIGYNKDTLSIFGLSLKDGDPKISASEKLEEIISNQLNIRIDDIQELVHEGKISEDKFMKKIHKHIAHFVFKEHYPKQPILENEAIDLKETKKNKIKP